MKKIVIAALIAAALVAGSPLFAQNNGKGQKSEYYYVSRNLEKIYPYRAGYVVQYRRGPNHLATTYLPSEWFTNAAAKGEIISLPRGNAWPTMAVYYKDGEFSHVRLYVHPVHTHQTWGIIPQNVNLDSRFENIESITLEF